MLCFITLANNISDALPLLDIILFPLSLLLPITYRCALLRTESIAGYTLLVLLNFSKVERFFTTYLVVCATKVKPGGLVIDYMNMWF
jgi:hypothetical protein